MIKTVECGAGAGRQQEIRRYLIIGQDALAIGNRPMLTYSILQI